VVYRVQKRVFMSQYLLKTSSFSDFKNTFMVSNYIPDSLPSCRRNIKFHIKPLKFEANTVIVLPATDEHIKAVTHVART
jgi:hypothetical protein